MCDGKRLRETSCFTELVWSEAATELSFHVQLHIDDQDQEEANKQQ